MQPLQPAFRRQLRARAHPLHPVVSIGHQGLTPSVLHEIDIALKAHELIKVRVFNDDRRERESMLARIADELDCAPVQQIGKLLVLWRPRPADDQRATEKASRAPADDRRPSAAPRRRRVPNVLAATPRTTPRTRNPETKNTHDVRAPGGKPSTRSNARTSASASSAGVPFKGSSDRTRTNTSKPVGERARKPSGVTLESALRRRRRVR